VGQTLWVVVAAAAAAAAAAVFIHFCGVLFLSVIRDMLLDEVLVELCVMKECILY
jgi:hypothetical protein